MHLPDPKLYQWANGDQLSAAKLNFNFGMLHGLAESAAALALEPDPDVALALERCRALAARVAELERDAATERKPHPSLAAFTRLSEQVERLAKREAGHALKADAQDLRAIARGLAGRLSMLEGHPAPPAPSVEEHAALKAEMERVRAESRLAWSQVAGLRADLAGVRKLVADDQRSTRYVPLSVLGEMLQRFDAFGARLEAFRASTAAEDVAAMREQVAELRRLIADTDRKEALHRMFTPRSMAAYLLRRVERLEGRAA